MELVNLMYRYVNRFINNNELIKKMGDKSKEMSKEFDIMEIFKKLQEILA